MEFELIKHSIINFVGNVVVYFLLAMMVSFIISICFGIKNDYLPFGWVKKLYESWVKPMFDWLFEKILLLGKILFKLIVFTLERLAILLADVFGKFFELLRNPED